VTILTLVAMLASACPLLPAPHREPVARVLLRELGAFERSKAVLAVAVMREESRGLPTACNGSLKSGSARGPMQVWVPRSRCGDKARPELYDPVKGTRAGVRILATHLRACGGDERCALGRYSGDTRSGKYAERVLAARGRIEEKR